jgi:tetratricopeptide (TPR) repeat protein
MNRVLYLTPRRAEAKDLLQELMIWKPKVTLNGQPGQSTPAETEMRVGRKLGPPVEATVAPQPASSGEEIRARPWADLLMGIIRFEEGDMNAALSCLLRAESADPHLPDLHLRIGETYLRQKRDADADRAFQRALEIDGDSPEAHLGLAVVRIRKRRNEEAAEEALSGVGVSASWLPTRILWSKQGPCRNHTILSFCFHLMAREAFVFLPRDRTPLHARLQGIRANPQSRPSTTY